MNRIQLRDLLVQLALSESPDEESCRQRMLELLDTTADCFYRTAFPAHFTGSALVVSADRQRVLLHHHRKLDRWMQFGGHCDGEEDVLRVAQREAWEESGIEGLIPDSPFPVDLDIHEIPARPAIGEPAHFHFDIRFLFTAPPDAQFVLSDESVEIRWFGAQELRALPLGCGLQRLIQKGQISPIP